MLVPVPQTKTPRALIAAFALSVLPLGALTVAQTDVTALGTTILDGSYQRVYEDRFKAGLAGQEDLVDAWSALRLALLGEVADGAVLGRDGWLFTAEEFTAPAQAVDLTERLTGAQAALSARGIALLPVIVPDKARMAAAKLPMGRSARFVGRYDARLAEIAALDLPVLDLRPALAAPDSYLRTDTHWAPGGAQRVAGLIADHLRDADLTRSTFTTQFLGTAPMQGDLMKFARTGRWVVPHAPAPEQIATFQTTGGGLSLLGDAPVEVALVGTSFSARPDIHFDGFLKNALNADVVNYAEEGQGPFAPMAAFLTALASGDLPPLRVVIWEIPERYLTPL